MTFQLLSVPTYPWLQNTGSSAQTYDCSPCAAYIAGLQASLQLRDSYLGNGPGGAPKAEGQKREILAFLQVSGAGEGMRAGQTGHVGRQG